MMGKAIWAVATAAVVAAIITFIPSLSAVEASPRAVKGDRLDIRSAASCAERAWPYYGRDCLRGAPKSVRIVSTDRISR
jgi:hypothetical protein